MTLRRRVHPNHTCRLRRADCADDASCGKDEGAEGCGDGAAEAVGGVAVHFGSPVNGCDYATMVKAAGAVVAPAVCAGASAPSKHVVEKSAVQRTAATLLRRLVGL